jgi:opacity protein-like surface antigen
MCFASHAQYLTHDIGVHVGVHSMQTDYGTRGDFLSMFGNTGTNFSLTHTLSFFQTRRYWNADDKILDYIAIRTELNVVNTTDLEHFGRFVNTNTDLGRQLRAMTGTASVVSIGMQLEYYFFCLRDFSYPYSDMKFNPYILAGLQYSSFNNSLRSDLLPGDGTSWMDSQADSDLAFPDKWARPGGTDVGPGTTFAATFGGGIRYNLSKKIDLNFQANWQFFFSNSVDGLTAEDIDDRNNEWLLNFQVGVIYRLNILEPLRFVNLFSTY